MGGKAEKGTPKYIANKMKAKGLQKLRWYCQMCQKQCRDENGFKCHTMSESHQRQLLLFADNASKYIDDFSRQFAEGYLELLKRQCGTKRVNANKIYQDYISHRDHYHMNATQWETLTEFVKWLGREGKCAVDETEKGWFVAYIDRDPAAIAAQEAQAKKEKLDKDDQDRMLEFINKQVERGMKSGKVEEPTFTEFKRSSSQEKLTLNLSLKRKNDDKKAEPLSSSAFKIKKDLSKKSKFDAESSKKQSALDDIMEMEEKAKDKANRRDYWLTEGITVKVVTKSLGDKYYKSKGIVDKVIDTYGAEIKLIDGGTRLKLDQEHLETVIPAAGRTVKFVNGAYRGLAGILRDIDTKLFCCEVEISEGPLTGRRVMSVQYEDQKTRIGICQRAMECSILGVKRTNKVRNSILRSKTQVIDAAQEAATLKWNWADHVCRMSGDQWPKIITDWAPFDRRKQRGRPRRRWKDVLYTFLRDWSKIAKNRERWKREGRPLPNSGTV